MGLKRRNFSREATQAVKHAFHIVFHSKLRQEPAIARVREEGLDAPEVGRLLAFLESSERGVSR